MRKLILTRGHPGSGKSHAIRQLGLEDWTLSSDALRLIYSAPVMNQYGRIGINQAHGGRVFPMLANLADERMKRGETLVIDTAMVDRSDLKKYMALADQHRYEVAVLDMSGTPLDLALARNASRDETRRTPDGVVEDFREAILSNPLGEEDGCRLVYGSSDNSHIAELREWLEVPVHDLSGWNSVVHIGDLQGCISVLAGQGAPLADGLRDDTYYVFIGDLLDRGIENGEVMNWFRRNALGKPNVALLWGNHEDHLHLMAKGMGPVSNEFALRTLPQLEEIGFTAADADEVCAFASEVLMYEYRGKRVLATHAGLAGVPRELHKISLSQYSGGTGNWSDPVDEQFERNNTDGTFQVHGHRNHGNVGIRATRHSFNLEDSVEFGGHLRICTLDGSGWKTSQHRNHVFRPLKERLSMETVMSAARKQERKAIPHWVMDGSNFSKVFDPATLTAMREHVGVRERNSERFPHVASLNFTRKVFYDRSWDDVVVKARGLFFDLESHEIVARGYEKFFNVGEREETSLNRLLGKMKFPITLYIKENGFLGNIGYDKRTDSLFVASKSTPDGDFADIFREIFEAAVNENSQERMRRFLRDTESSMTFEVIDPVRDPHMIEYDAPKLVLLDILQRTTEFRKASFPVLEAVGRKLGLETKKQAMVFRTPAAFAGWYSKAANDLGYKVSGSHVEGLVIEDAAGFMTKVKLPYYAFWKQMRGMKDRIVSAREKGKEFSWSHTRRPDGETPAEHEIEMAHDFRDWCLDQDTAVLKDDIITLRKAFGRDFGDEVTPVRAPVI